jgi:hypothetical protein
MTRAGAGQNLRFCREVFGFLLMNTRTVSLIPWIWFWLTVVVCSGLCTPVFGQSLPDRYEIFRREPVLPRDLGLNLDGGDALLLSRSSMVRLFRMPTAFPLSPLGLDADDDLPPNDDKVMGSRDANGSSDGRLLLSMGTDNPFFDFRRPGDPGGVGYFKLHSQYLIFDSPNSCFSLGLQAVTPAGQDADGISQGPTIFSPHVACFYDLGGGTALHGFCGKKLRAGPGLSDGLERDLRYGLALQCPLPGLAKESSLPAVHVFFEALGRNRFNGNSAAPPGGRWELVPGIQCRMGQSWWLSGGLLMPLNSPQPDRRLWQLTCSWQF